MAIKLDAVSSDGGTTTTLTFSHTCTGSDRILFVGVGIENATDVITGITYNSVSMTKIDTQINAGPNEVVSLFYLIAPATGANDIVISASGSIAIDGVGVSYTGALQSGVPDASGKAENSASTSITKEVTTILNNCWMISVCMLDAGVPAASTGVTSRAVNTNTRIGDSNALITPAGAYSMTYTGSSGRFIIVQASFSPAPSGSFIPLL